MKSPKVWSFELPWTNELWSLRKVDGCQVYLALVSKGLIMNRLHYQNKNSTFEEMIEIFQQKLHLCNKIKVVWAFLTYTKRLHMKYETIVGCCF